MKYLNALFIIVVLNSCFSLKGKFENERLVIFEKENTSLPKFFCGMEDKFTPTENEIVKAEKLVYEHKQVLKNGFYDFNLNMYRKQYCGFINKDKEKIILINMLHNKLFRNKKGDDWIYFKTEFSQGFGENYEKYARIILVNIDANYVYFPCDF